MGEKLGSRRKNAGVQLGTRRVEGREGRTSIDVFSSIVFAFLSLPFS